MDTSSVSKVKKKLFQLRDINLLIYSQIIIKIIIKNYNYTWLNLINTPLGHNEAMTMIKSLKSYKLIEGVRKREGVNQEIFADIMVKLSALLNAAPEIMELDLNPLLGKADSVIAVDGRIRIEK